MSEVRESPAQPAGATRAVRPALWILLGLSLIATGVLYALVLQKEAGSFNPNSPASAATGEPTLDEDQRTYVWEVEHAVLVLKKHGLKPFLNAIKAAEFDALGRYLAPEFQAKIVVQGDALLRSGDFGMAKRISAHEAPLETRDGAAFVAWIEEKRQAFKQVDEVGFGLKRFSPLDREDLDGPWRTDGYWRIAGTDTEGRPLEFCFHAEIELERPTEANLDRGGWFRSYTIDEWIETRAVRPLMREVAAERGLQPDQLHDNWKSKDTAFHTGGAYVADYNRDGVLDVLLNDIGWNYGFRLYRGRPGGSFEDVTVKTGLDEVQSPGCVAFADLDGDGWEDLVLGTRVFRNEDGERFVEVSAQSNLREMGLDSQCKLAVADFDRDGRLDLYASRSTVQDHRQGSWIGGHDCADARNILLRNKGGWQFEDVTQTARASGGARSTFTSVWLDADGDAWPDLYVIHEFGNGVLLLNRRDGTFAERPLCDEQTDFGSMGLAAGDVNNDGHMDLYLGQMYSKAGTRVIGNLRPDSYAPEVMQKLSSLVRGNELYLNRGEKGFEPAGEALQVNAVGWAFGACLADLDNDGWLDIHATCGFITRSSDKPDG